jgi:hypothetical protein
LSYILIKIVGEEDNNGHQTEFFRVAKKFENLLINPELHTRIVLEDGEFWIHDIVQHLPYRIVYLFEETFYNHYKFWGIKKDFDKLKEQYIEEGWVSTKRKFPKKAGKEEWTI